ncbi:AAA family ATPase [Euzebya sp.]|uniref:AAA family ATPase n=1 Tax=Euzebya sp. TaxID=1971409 RepID=UPI00351918CD
MAQVHRDGVRDDDTDAGGGRSAAAGAVAARLGGGLVGAHHAGVGASRERARLRRLRVLAVVLGVPTAYLWWRILDGRAIDVLQVPDLGEDALIWVLPIVIVIAIGIAVAMPFLSGRSPHARVQPEQIDLTFADVVGLDGVVDEVTRTLHTFMGHKLYRDALGGTPRRGVLFEGAPGTGKTHLAKAMAREAGVPFLFVSATSFQSMWYGATARKIRSYFAALRKAAREEGGAIGFIEEIDAIAQSRSGMRAASQPAVDTAVAASCLHQPAGPIGGPDPGMAVSHFGSSDGASGVVNELLVQLQSFDTPPTGIRVRNWLAAKVNAFLPAHRQIAARPSPYHNILVIAATNRAADHDPALLRPGRVDKQLAFEAPAQPQRRALIDHFLARKAHGPDLDDDRARDVLAGQTLGYTPVMIENLLDEALIVALKHGRDGMTSADVHQARLDIEIGLATPAPYTTAERLRVATHESGHAVMAFLSGHRRLEILSIIKRKAALGLLAHGDTEEVFTRTRKQMYDLVDIAMGGKAAEEIWFGSASTGPGSDLAAATKTACEIIGLHGMGDSLVSLAAVQQSSVSSTNIVGRVLADSVTRPQVDRLLSDSLARTTTALEANRHLVEALRDALLDREELIGDEILDVIAAAGPPVHDDLTVEVDDAVRPEPA